MPSYLQRESNKVTIANFYEGYELGKYNFDPPYQRRSLWTDEKKSFLIDSIIKNYPIPPIFLHQKIDDATGKTCYDIIDGKQRLTAIIEFIQNIIPVADEGVDEDEESPIAGMYFGELSGPQYANYKSRFWRYVIPVEYVDTGAQQVIDSIFDRLNRNGEPLRGQELRNSSYYGSSLLNLLETLSKTPFWQTRLAVVDRSRMEEIEFLSELAFLVLEGEELKSNQTELDKLYDKYAESADVDYAELMDKLAFISNYMESLGLDYAKRKIGGVSHLYGLFSFCANCVQNGISVDEVKGKINDFYDCWEAKEYGQQHIREYKESMSARTRDQGQRKKRRKALVDFCAA